MKHAFSSLPLLTVCHLLEDPRGERILVLNDALSEPAGGNQRYATITAEQTGNTDSLISFSAFSTESEPWQILRPTASAKSPRIVPVFLVHPVAFNTQD